ncbi:assimilatory sulfite reductase (NADPH) hemoprotein subunit [Dokdonella sp.]|uniref:assimilatory sulfite reductase (NADPH) hemoprotein subunit n=1 Tax=Dokdonella sp. TaxID=2291710 RepID=UPI001B08AEEB|nr:assimilatory sulfite reductase (NADPH) hemoprotein subunit [Dokdonella sp.]MBO9664662.1 assimilatory sulfite reductase (NADPH) hemoprotein subunit [Dokdonella sp.]
MTAPLSPVEKIKTDSRHLRGTLTESLLDPVTGAIADDDTQLIKFHGSYQQDDRDLREERRQQKLEPAYSFMIRTRTPGGVVTPEQWLKLDAIATTFANGTLRLTTRQAFQFHGVVKRELRATLQAINASLIDTIAACGDVNRNVIVGVNPHASRVHAVVQDAAIRLSERLKPKTRAYYEIWLGEEKIADSEAANTWEPVYGKTYLPRKFKVAFALPPSNDVDVFAHDLGFIAIVERGALIGFNVSVGGGMGATHGDDKTFPRLADLLGFISVEQLLAVAEAVATTQRDFGDRSDRKHARLKYTIEDRGIDWFKREVERRLGFALLPPRPFAFDHVGDRFGWSEGHDGRWHLNLRIEAGRVADRGERTLLTGLREIAQILGDGEFRLTPNQNLIVANVAPDQRAAIDALVARHGLDGFRTASPLRLNALACVALPTCALAMAEAERYLPNLLEKIEALLAAHDLADAPIGLRVSGCPNGCSRPYLAEIALIGKAPGRYNLMLGADARGQRLNRLHRENIDEAEILAQLDALFARYADEREAGEGFGDFLLRAGVIALPRRLATPLETTT